MSKTSLTCKRILFKKLIGADEVVWKVRDHKCNLNETPKDKCFLIKIRVVNFRSHEIHCLVLVDIPFVVIFMLCL